MGVIRMGLPEELALFLKEQTNSNTFIETGTYYAGTTLWAAKYFNNVHTIELSEVLYKKVSPQHAHITNIQFHFGDSREQLKTILNTIDESVILWLDAHWSSGETYGEDDNCPLIKELEIINQSNKNACILIDDARLFLAPPNLPNNLLQYPGIQDIVKIFGDDKFIAVYEDVIIVVPESIKDKFQQYLQSRTTIDWQNYANEPDISARKVVKMLYRKLRKNLIDK